MSKSLATEWRRRIAIVADEAARKYGASLGEVDGLTVFAIPKQDAYCVLLEWSGRTHEVAVQFDAEELAIADESAPGALQAIIEARIAYEVGRYFAARGETWRPGDER